MPDGDGTLDVDRYCLSCGYNLRGLPGEPIRCPECGTFHGVCARYSIRRSLFRFNPRYRVLDAKGRRVYAVRQRHLTIAEEYCVVDRGEVEVARIRRRSLSPVCRYDVDWADAPHAVVRKSLFGGLWSPTLSMDIPELDSPAIECRRTGWRRYELRRGSMLVGQVRVPWFTAVPTYRVEIAPTEDALPLVVLVLLLGMELRRNAGT